MMIEPRLHTPATFATVPLMRSCSSCSPTLSSVAGALAVAVASYASEGWASMPATDAATLVASKLPSLGAGAAVLSTHNDEIVLDAFEREVNLTSRLYDALRGGSARGAAAAEHYAAQVQAARVALDAAIDARAAHTRRFVQRLVILRGSLLEGLEVYGDWFTAMRALDPDAERFVVPERYVAPPRDVTDDAISLADLDAAVRVEDWLEGG